MYAPNDSAAINTVMKYFSPLFEDVIGFPDSASLDSYYSVRSSNVTAAGIVFDSKYKSATSVEELKNLKVQIR